MDPYDNHLPAPLPPTGTQRNPPRSGPQSITVISQAAGSAFDEISQQRPGRLRVNVLTPCSRGRPSYAARQRSPLLLCLPFRRVGSCEAMCKAASRLWRWHGRSASRLAPLTPQMSGSVRKSFCASRHQTPVMPHLRSQSPTLQNSFCSTLVGGDRSLIHINVLPNCSFCLSVFPYRHLHTMLQRENVVRLAGLLQTIPTTGTVKEVTFCQSHSPFLVGS